MCVECYRRDADYDLTVDSNLVERPTLAWQSAGLLRDGNVIMRIEAARDGVDDDDYAAMLGLAAGA